DLPAWSEEEIEFLRSAADITAVAMQHAAIRSHVRALSASAAGINARAGEQVLLKRLTEAAVSVTGSTIGTAGVREGDQMVSRHLWRRGEWEAVEARFSSGQGLVGWCWSHRAPCIANEAAADPRTDQALVASWGIRSALVLPILDPEGQV